MRILLLCMVSFLWVACGSKEKNNKEDEVFLPYNETMKQGVVQMEKLYVHDTVQYDGHKYEYEVTRVCDSTLPKVKDAEMDVTYMDNSITMIIRKDGAVLYQKKYVKSDFNTFLDAGFKKDAVLDGFLYNKIDKQGLWFTMSVSYPQSDMYIPILLNVTPDGSVSMKKDELIECDIPGEGA